MTAPAPACPRSAALPVAAIVLNALLWGLSWWPLHVLQDQGLHPLWATVLMYCFPTLGLVALYPRLPAEFARQPGLWWLLLAAGLTNTCFNWAVTIGDVIRVVLLFYLMPVWAVFLAWWLVDEKPTAAALLRVLLALAGVTLVLQPAGSGWTQWQLPWPRSLPDVLGLLGGLCFAATNVLLNKTAQASAHSRVFAMFAGGVLLGSLTAWLALQAGAAGVTPVPQPQGHWIGLVLLFSTAFVASNVALQYGAARLSSHALSLIMLLEVLFAAASSAWAGTGTLTPHVLAGGALVLSAAALAAWSSH